MKLLTRNADDRNINTTNIEVLSERIVKFCRNNPKLLQKLNIKDIHTLSPKKAILLTQEIVKERLNYSPEQMAVKQISQSTSLKESLL